MVQYVHKTRPSAWLDPTSYNDWLPKEDLPADSVVYGFRISGCEFSVYELGESGPSVEEIAAALIAGGQTLSEFNYIVLGPEIIAALDFGISVTKGSTLNKNVNQFHRDIEHVSAMRLFRLVGRLLEARSGDVCLRVQRKQVALRILADVESGRLPKDKVNPKVLEEARKATRQ